MKKLFKNAKSLFASFAIIVSIFSFCFRTSAADVLDNVIFFGDSTTAHMAVRGGIPHERVWSGAENTVRFSTVNSERCVHLSTGEDLTLADAARRIKPKTLVITLGVSGGAGVMSEKDFKDTYRKMLLSVKEASPNTKIYVQSILPLSDKSVKYYKKITKEAVAEANGWIKDVCRSLGVSYINTHDILIDENGYLKQEYQNDEYMHLTKSAYEVILSNIRKSIINS